MNTRWRSLQRAATNFLIVFYLYTAFLMAWPWPAAERLKSSMIGPFASQALNDLGIYHRLRLFSPDPPTHTGYLTFEVQYDNGMRRNWVYPRKRLSPGDPPNSYRRYLFYYLCWNYRYKYPAVWPAFARYISKNCEMGDARPITVRFLERCALIPPPSDGIGKGWVEPDQTLLLYTYDVGTNTGTVGKSIEIW